MSVAVKICGVNDMAAAQAAVAGGAQFVGFVFYPPSPRYVTPEAARELAQSVPEGITKVGVVVDPKDDLIETLVRRSGLDMLQFHGNEAPGRVFEIRTRFGVQAMKAIKVARAEDLDAALPYARAADWIMFDSKAPPGRTDVMPGGNAVAFDWQVLATADLERATGGRPWMLSGGLTVDNVAEAVEITGSRAVDVSSGVEKRPGIKDPDMISAFLAEASALNPLREKSRIREV